MRPLLWFLLISDDETAARADAITGDVRLPPFTSFDVGFKEGLNRIFNIGNIARLKRNVERREMC